jgi:hypothetical protein
MSSFWSTWIQVRRRLRHRREQNVYYTRERDAVNERRVGYSPPNRERSLKTFAERHPRANRKYQLKHKYGLTVEAWEKLFDAQGRRCAICGSNKPGSREWHTDHDHATKQVRGILCQHCNHLVGNLGDNAPEVRKRTAAILTYLEQTPMSRIVDDEPPIKTHPANQAYRDNYDRIFGKKAEHVDGCIVPNCPGCDDGHPEAADPDAIECRLSSYANFEKPVIAVFGPVEAPADPCDVCGAAAGEWCKHGCSEGPPEPNA